MPFGRFSTGAKRIFTTQKLLQKVIRVARSRAVCFVTFFFDGKCRDNCRKILFKRPYLQSYGVFMQVFCRSRCKTRRETIPKFFRKYSGIFFPAIFGISFYVTFELKSTLGGRCRTSCTKLLLFVISNCPFSAIFFQIVFRHAKNGQKHWFMLFLQISSNFMEFFACLSTGRTNPEEMQRISMAHLHWKNPPKWFVGAEKVWEVCELV